MKRPPMTVTQEEMLLWMLDFMHKNKFPPTYRDIMEGMGFSSTNAVVGHMKELERKGYVSIVANSSRAIEIVAPDRCPYCHCSSAK